MGTIQSLLERHSNQVNDLKEFILYIFSTEILVTITPVICHKIINFSCQYLSSDSEGTFNETRSNFIGNLSTIYIVLGAPFIEEIMFSFPYTSNYIKSPHKNYLVFFGHLLSAIFDFVTGYYELILINLVSIIVKIKCKQPTWRLTSIGLYSILFGISHSPTNQINHVLQSILIFSVPKIIYFLISDHIAKTNPIYGILFSFVHHTFHNGLQMAFRQKKLKK